MFGNETAHKLDQTPRTGDVLLDENVDFASLLLSDHVSRGLQSCGFNRPSPIQLKAVPLGRCGLDLIVQAKSGTGKTCVFTIISLEGIVTESSSLQVLILAPTREIAVQIWEVINAIGQFMPKLRCYTFIGGLPVADDIQKLKKCHIAVGTPGRIQQLIENGDLRTENIRLFVLDEADKLLEESFQKSINWIYSTLPENKQMLALSATYPEVLAQHLTSYMRNPTFIRLNSSDPALLGIRQYFKTVNFHPLSHKAFENKVQELLKLLSSINFNQCLVFSNYQVRAQSLSDMLNTKGWPATYISGSQDQQHRLTAMAKLKKYKCRILISTDLSSRGIDAEHVNLVINLDLPRDHETYLHRIGRAGRFGTYGAGISLVCDGNEVEDLKVIEEKCLTRIPPLPDPVPVDLAKSSSYVSLNNLVTTEQLTTRPATQQNVNNTHTVCRQPRRTENRDVNNENNNVKCDPALIDREQNVSESVQDVNDSADNQNTVDDVIGGSQVLQNGQEESARPDAAEQDGRNIDKTMNGQLHIDITCESENSKLGTPINNMQNPNRPINESLNGLKKIPDTSEPSVESDLYDSTGLNDSSICDRNSDNSVVNVEDNITKQSTSLSPKVATCSVDKGNVDCDRISSKSHNHSNIAQTEVGNTPFSNKPTFSIPVKPEDFKIPISTDKEPDKIYPSFDEILTDYQTFIESDHSQDVFSLSEDSRRKLSARTRTNDDNNMDVDRVSQMMDYLAFRNNQVLETGKPFWEIDAELSKAHNETRVRSSRATQESIDLEKKASKLSVSIVSNGKTESRSHAETNGLLIMCDDLPRSQSCSHKDHVSDSNQVSTKIDESGTSMDVHNSKHKSDLFMGTHTQQPMQNLLICGQPTDMTLASGDHSRNQSVLNNTLEKDELAKQARITEHSNRNNPKARQGEGSIFDELSVKNRIQDDLSLGADYMNRLRAKSESSESWTSVTSYDTSSSDSASEDSELNDLSDEDESDGRSSALLQHRCHLTGSRRPRSRDRKEARTSEYFDEGRTYTKHTTTAHPSVHRYNRNIGRSEYCNGHAENSSRAQLNTSAKKPNYRSSDELHHIRHHKSNHRHNYTNGYDSYTGRDSAEEAHYHNQHLYTQQHDFLDSRASSQCGFQTSKSYNGKGYTSDQYPPEHSKYDPFNAGHDPYASYGGLFPAHQTYYPWMPGMMPGCMMPSMAWPPHSMAPIMQPPSLDHGQMYYESYKWHSQWAKYYQRMYQQVGQQDTLTAHYHAQKDYIRHMAKSSYQ